MEPIWSSLPQCYEIDTGVLHVGIQPYTSYHGICGLMHRDWKIEAVRHGKSFLNAEYYLRPGSGKKMYARAISRARRTSHDTRSGGVAVRFPREPDFRIELDLIYRTHDDCVDMVCAIRPAVDVTAFELFFASYVVEAFDETWAPLQRAGGSDQWVKLDNRRVLNRVFDVARDAGVLEQSNDGRYGADPEGSPRTFAEERYFSKPILVARSSTNGFSLVFLYDPSAATLLTGQYHGWDTAHDWCYGWDLKAGHEVTARTRLVYRQFRTISAMAEAIGALWESFAAGAGPESEAGIA